MNDSFLSKIGGFSGTGAEISAFDPTTQRLFVISGGTELQILDLSDPTNPTLIETLDVSEYGGGANSVAIKNGIVAIAVAADPTTGPGQVVFFSPDGTFLNAVAVGALPDMLTFTPDGTKVLVTNEGEPNEDYTIDPEGSVSIIDLAGGVENATVATADFQAFNDRQIDLEGQGVRIFGLNATVAQDVEPEYIAISADGTTARVTLQEANAIAVVDIATATVTEIQPLGYRDYSRGLPTVTTYEFSDDRPVLGTTETTNPSDPTQTTSGQEILLGGFSGLFFEGFTEDGKLKFITNTDRGPNGEPTDLVAETEGNERPFALPDFQPELVRFELDRTTGEITITERIGLTRTDGSPLTGLPNIQNGETGTAYTDEVPIDLFGNLLSNDPLGADLEGLVVADDGTFWLGDEYRPAIYHFDSSGKLIDRFIPEGEPTSGGEFGTAVLPAVYAQRRANRGFEAVALEGNKLYAFIQSAIDNPDTAEDDTSRSSRNLRILEFDIETQTVTGEYLYVLDDISSSGSAKTDKIGDAVSLGNGKFLVVERDDRSTADSNKLIYEIDLSSATNLISTPIASDKTLEELSIDELSDLGVQAVEKRLVTNAAAIGYTGVEKLEGLALIDQNTIALINDNDFGLLGEEIAGDGTVPVNPTPIKLGIVEFNQSNGLDASDEDGGINIQNQPVFGMYQPDAIASFTAEGETYYITANEGDSRVRPTEDDAIPGLEEGDIFNEESRVEDLVLDPIAFPNAAELQLPENLGRLVVTNTMGDLDGDGDYDQLFAYGGRSFSIRDAAGNLVYDSGDDFEQITAVQIPESFNSDGDAESFDSRSDNKGPEPEGAVTARINDRSYAFIGLERTGGVMVYEVTNPEDPQFVQYLPNQDGDLGPEGLTFISAEDSPNEVPLLVITNEVSNTVTILEANTQVRISDIQGAAQVSPLLGQAVIAVPGIVTAVDSNGFYLQDPTPDDNDATSEGLFVFTDDAPTVQVGDSVTVSGTVSEFQPGGSSSNNLTTTQISGDLTIEVISSGNPLPDAVIISAEGRTPPTEIINNDATAPTAEGLNNSPFDPAEDGIDFYESLEGMRVTIQDAIAVSPTSQFGEIFTLADNGAGATGLSDRGTINISPDDFNPERIQVQFNDDLLPDFEVDVNAGAQLGDVTGVVGYGFGNFEVNVTETFTPIDSTLEPEVSELVGTETQLTIAAYNVENLDPKVEDPALTEGGEDDVDDDVGEGKFDAIAAHIVENLNTPDIISLEEIQDSNGAELSDIISADATLQLLIDKIAELSGITYEFIDNPFIGNETNGGQPGGNIRTAFLYNPDRVTLVEDSLRTVTDPVDQQTNEDNPFSDSRLPLAATFIFNEEEVTVVSNHFTSKGGSAPLFGQIQPSVELQEDPEVNGGVEVRQAQAELVKTFVDGILAEDPNANMVVAGDLNEFEFIGPIDILEQSLTNLTETLPENERYSYIFEGNSQSLDHILVSSNLASGAEFDSVHVNSEFAENASDHDPLLTRLTLTGSDFSLGTTNYSSTDLIQVGNNITSGLGVQSPF